MAAEFDEAAAGVLEGSWRYCVNGGMGRCNMLCAGNDIWNYINCHKARRHHGEPACLSDFG